MWINMEILDELYDPSELVKNPYTYVCKLPSTSSRRNTLQQHFREGIVIVRENLALIRKPFNAKYRIM